MTKHRPPADAARRRAPKRGRARRASLRLLAPALGLAVLAACATPARQAAAETPGDFAGPRLELEAGRFVSFDGAELGAQAWLPADHGWTEGVRGVIAGVHGMGDYSETFYLAGPWWAARGYAVYAYDQRGFGRSPRRGVWPEKAVQTADVTAFTAALRARHPGKTLGLVGVSMGAAASLAALDSAAPPDVDAAVMVSPAVWGWSQMNPLYGLALRMANAVAPGWTLTGAGLERQPSDNIEMLRKLSADPLMVRETRVDAIHGLVDLMEAGWEAEGADVAVPMMIAMGERDEIVPPGVIQRYARRQAPQACFVTYGEGYHMLLRDLQAETVWADVLRFIQGDCPARDRSIQAGPAPEPGRSAR